MLSRFLMETATRSLWETILEDPRFQDLPYKVETNARGQIILSPHKFRHSQQQRAIMRLLEDQAEQQGLEGASYPEVAIQTADGVRTADVVWISAKREAEMPLDAPACPIAPEVCVEVLSASNTAEEMARKRHLYMERGAQEVWTVAESGAVAFYDAGGELSASKLFLDFPRRMEVVRP